MTGKRILSLLLALVLTVCVGCGGQQHEQGTQQEEKPPEQGTPDEIRTGTLPGDRIADFTVTTYDGHTIQLSEILAEKKLVLINIWATWCGPCRMEFPFMEEAYQKFGDDVEIIALSGDPSDTNEMIGELAAELGLTFPMGQDSVGLTAQFGVSAFPTTIVVDRFGTICLIEAGAQTSAEGFENLFEFFAGDWYTEPVVLDGFPDGKPAAERLPAEELSAALSGEKETLRVENDPNVFLWPMAVTEQDGRSVLTATNSGVDSSEASACLTVKAKAGEVLAFDFRVSCEKGFDYLRLYVDGKVVKRFTGEKDWASYAYAFETDGEHRVKLVYHKDYTGEGGADTVWLDNVRLLSGNAASTALEGNPAYPFGGENTIRPVNEGARKIAINDPNGVLLSFFGQDYDAYIIHDVEARFAVTLAEGVDPDAAICYNNQFLVHTMADSLTAEGYVFSYTVDSMATTGGSGSYLAFLPDAEVQEMYPVLIFADEENATAFIQTNTGGTWEYADDEGTSTNFGGDVEYTLKFVDQHGNAVQGVVAKVCNAESCVMAVSDEDGLCRLTLAPYAYEVQILKIPEGYTPGKDKAYTLSERGGELTIPMIRE